MGRAKEIIVKVIPSSIANAFVKKNHYTSDIVIFTCLFRMTNFRADFDHNPSGSHSAAKRVIPIKHTMRALNVHPKEYPGLGIMYNFMVEEIFDYGPVNVAKFARY